VRIRTILTLSVGAAIGAGAMYLLDPDHGEGRRRDVRRHALTRAREGALHAVDDARSRAEELVTATVAGYREARTVDS